MQLAGVTQFVYYPPGRVIVKQNREGLSLYFIVTGEVTVSQEQFDPVLNELRTVVVGTMEAGMMFGEVSLLHDIPRTATITTLTHCELLCLKKDDFNVVLKSSLQQEWNSILKALRRFEYFNDWSEVSNRECCIYSKIRKYEKGDVVYQEGTMATNYAFFLLEGSCVCIHELPVIERNVNGIKKYELFDTETYKEQLSQGKGRRKLKVQKLAPLAFKMSKPDETKDDSSKISTSKSSATKTRDSKSKVELKVDNEKSKTDARKSSVSFNELNKSTKSKLEAMKHKRESETIKSTVSLVKTSKSRTSAVNKSSHSVPKLKVISEEHKKSLKTHKQDSMTQPKTLRNDSTFECLNSALKLPTHVKKIFMQIYILRELAAFGMGENLSNRFIVAQTNVECLAIPNFWLWSKNKGNVLTKIQLYLKNHIPNEKEIFRIFCENRKWGEYKRELVKEIRGKRPENCINNVPYSIRIDEDIPYQVRY